MALYVPADMLSEKQLAELGFFKFRSPSGAVYVVPKDPSKDPLWLEGVLMDERTGEVLRLYTFPDPDPEEPGEVIDLAWSDYFILKRRLQQQLETASGARRKEILRALLYLEARKSLWTSGQQEQPVEVSLDRLLEEFSSAQKLLSDSRWDPDAD